MAKYRKKPVVIEAVQWHTMGDHPAVIEIPDDVLKREAESGVFASQRGFHPSVCGWIKSDEGGYIVAPQDFIITGVNGENYACKPDVFWKTYESADAHKEQTFTKEQLKKAWELGAFPFDEVVESLT